MSEHWELYCILSALEDLTCKIGMTQTEKTSADFCKAVGVFRAPLIEEIGRVGSLVEKEIAYKLAEKKLHTNTSKSLSSYPKSIQETVYDVLSRRRTV